MFFVNIGRRRGSKQKAIFPIVGKMAILPFSNLLENVFVWALYGLIWSIFQSLEDWPFSGALFESPNPNRKNVSCVQSVSVSCSLCVLYPFNQYRHATTRK